MNAHLRTIRPRLLSATLALAALATPALARAQTPAPTTSTELPPPGGPQARPIVVSLQPQEAPPTEPVKPRYKLGLVVPGAVVAGLGTLFLGTAIGIATIRNDGEWEDFPRRMAIFLGSVGVAHLVPGLALIAMGTRKPSPPAVSLSVRPLWATAPRGATSISGMAIGGSF